MDSLICLRAALDIIRGWRRQIVAIAILLLGVSTPAVEDASEGEAPTVVQSRVELARQLPSSPISAGFLGFSFEFDGVRTYTGRDATAVNPVLVQLTRDLSPGQAPVLRIGGNSTDRTWWPVADVRRPPSVSYSLTPGWLDTTSALARATGARMILGINLAMNRRALAATEARRLISGVGRHSTWAIEIGNEADLYRRFPRYRAADRRLRHVRGPSYSLATFEREFLGIRVLLPGVPIAGPTFGNRTWMPALGRFLDVQPPLTMVTFHRYPLSCFARRGHSNYPSIANLLSDTSSRALADDIASYVALAHARRVQFRLDELNSVSCGGRHGVSDTFASALWLLDTLFEMARVGVDGVNIHTLPRAAYEPFTFTHRHGRWSAFVHPSYYGMRMFAEATPRGSRLLADTNRIGSPVKVWSTVDAGGRIRYVLINKSAARRFSTLRVPGSPSTATVERLIAPRITARTAVSLGGRHFAWPTRTGTLIGRASKSTVRRTRSGGFVITLPPRSATLVTA